MVKRLLAGRYVIAIAAVLLAASAPLLVSCGDDDEPTAPTTPAFAYPHMNGAEWIYNYKGETAAKYTISGVFNHPTAGETQKFYEYVQGESGWELFNLYYLKATDNDVRLYLDPEKSQFTTLLKFPLKSGDTWDAGLGLTANVSGPEKVSVPAGSFNCFKIDYTGVGTSFTFWWPSNLGGIGAKNHGWWSLGEDPITTELASYNLPT
ncbi:MAG TPA: hypothetical protein VMX79_02360 [bacterium]|nr:hypothetical protein [bacterium]